MKRLFALWFVLLPLPLSAQEVVKPFVLPEGAERIKLALHPAAAPVPAFKYRLLPELRDVKTGNAVLLYYRSFAPDWQFYRKPEYYKPLNAWQENVRQPVPKELQWIETFAGLKEIDLGARRSYVDWEMTDRLRQDGIFFLLPDVQSFRATGMLLGARARLEAQAGRFDRAISTLQTGFKFGRDIADAPTLIQTLVGAAILFQFCVDTEEIVQSPAAPNLYWALTDLPQPYIRLQKPYQGERFMIDSLFPGVREMIDDPKAKPLGPAQMDAMLTRFLKDMRSLGESGEDLGSRLGLALLAARAYPEAKRFLLAQGRSKADVEAFSVLQAYVMLEVHNFDAYYDEFLKSVNLPYSQASKIARAAEMSLKRAKADLIPGTMLATLLVPAVHKVQITTARLDRRIAALRIIEALRLHLAKSDGKLPASLQEIKDLPLPLDPMTGAPFQYRLEKDHAILYAPAPAGETAMATNVLMYELHVKK